MEEFLNPNCVIDTVRFFEDGGWGYLVCCVADNEHVCLTKERVMIPPKKVSFSTNR